MLLLLLAAALGTALAQAPPLPDLALPTFPAAAREHVARVHEAARTHPDNAAAVGALGKTLHAWEQWESAHQAYARAAVLAPGTFDWPYLDAVVLQRLARHPAAVERLKQALSLDPGYLPARVRLAEALLEAGQLHESRPLFEALLRERAAEPAAHVGLGRIAAAEGRNGAAVAHFERAVTLFPELGAAHYTLARLYRSLGRADDAARAIEKHRQFGARWPGIEDGVLASIAGVRDDGRASLLKGIASAESGDVEAAIAAHEAALARDGSLGQAHANLLSLYGRARNWTKADEHYRAAVRAGVSTADLFYDYGVVQGLQEKWDAAEEAYRRAIDINGLHGQARNNLGQILERRRDFETAASEYRRAVEAQPTFRLARFNLGRMLLALGRPSEAVVELEKLQQPRDAEAPRYLFALATAQVRAGRTDLGMTLATDARNLALEHGQRELADAIARELAKLQ